MLKVFIFTEYGQGAGLGHIARCTALYEALEELNSYPVMVVNEDDPVEKIFPGKRILSHNWTENIDKWQRLKEADLVIVDSYKAKEDIYFYLSENFSPAVFIDDDVRLKYPEGIILNGAISAEKINYTSDREITYLLGCAYAPLRRTFWDVPPKDIANEIRTVLITVGGNDIRNLVLPLIGLSRKNFPSVKLKVLVDRSFADIDKIEKLAGDFVELVYKADADKIKEIMHQADLAVSAGGQTLYELARMGVPTIAIEVADNQRNNIEGWLNAGFVRFAGRWNDKDLQKNILKDLRALSEKKCRQVRSETAQKRIDGQGARRVAKKIVRQYFERQMVLRKAVAEDVKKIYEISNDEDVRKNSFNQEKIDFSQHGKWFGRKITDRNCLFLIAECNQRTVGQIRFDVEKDAVISISIHKDYRNMGIGNLMMKKALQFLKNGYPALGKVVAFVKDENIASKKYFEKCDFKYIRSVVMKEIPSVEYHYFFQGTA